ncbi:MAG: LysE family transporter [Proteobacteria bacterium]|nr:LysE family transporter [Pseudomonadota bacterium]
MVSVLKGFILGFSLAAPVGAIGLLVINRTIRKGQLYGFVSGLGATAADGVYGCIAGFSISAITNFIIQYGNIIKPIGCLAMILIGLKIFFSKKHFGQIKIKDSKNLVGAFSSVFFLTLSNPITVLFFIALFSGLGLNINEKDYFGIFIFIIGVLVGSASWWVILCGVTGVIRHRVSENTIGIINKISGTAIMIFGIIAYFKK